jgi:hypothetical protein
MLRRRRASNGPQSCCSFSNHLIDVQPVKGKRNLNGLPYTSWIAPLRRLFILASRRINPSTDAEALKEVNHRFDLQEIGPPAALHVFDPAAPARPVSRPLPPEADDEGCGVRRPDGWLVHETLPSAPTESLKPTASPSIISGPANVGWTVSMVLKGTSAPSAAASQEQDQDHDQRQNGLGFHDALLSA